MEKLNTYKEYLEILANAAAKKMEQLSKQEYAILADYYIDVYTLICKQAFLEIPKYSKAQVADDS